MKKVPPTVKPKRHDSEGRGDSHSEARKSPAQTSPQSQGEVPAEKPDVKASAAKTERKDNRIVENWGSFGQLMAKQTKKSTDAAHDKPAVEIARIHRSTK